MRGDLLYSEHSAIWLKPSPGVDFADHPTPAVLETGPLLEEVVETEQSNVSLKTIRYVTGITIRRDTDRESKMALVKLPSPFGDLLASNHDREGMNSGSKKEN